VGNAELHALHGLGPHARLSRVFFPMILLQHLDDDDGGFDLSLFRVF
jgi:hypothetical protein